MFKKLMRLTKKYWNIPAVIVLALVLALSIPITPAVSITTDNGFVGISLQTNDVYASEDWLPDELGTKGGYVKIEPSGCEEYHGWVKIRFDFFLNPEDYRYDDCHILVPDETSPEWIAGYTGKVDAEGIPVNQVQYDKWYESIPKVYVDKPFHSHFIYLEPDCTDKEIEYWANFHLANFYYAWCQDWADVAGGMRHGWATETRIRPERYDETLGKESVEYITLKTDCIDKVEEVKDLSISVVSGDGGETFPATEIDVGSAAIDRATTYFVRTSTAYNTVIDHNNAANDSGSIDTVEVYIAYTAGAEIKFGTFTYITGYQYQCNDGEVYGAVSAGYNSCTGLDIDISTGDYIGADARTTGNTSIDRDYGGGSGAYYEEGQYCNPSDYVTFNHIDTDSVLSLYGTGETAGGCVENISLGTYNSYNFGILDESETGQTAINYFQITNNSGGAVTITIQGTDLVGTGTDWDLADDATPGANTYGLKAGLDDDDDNFDIIVRESAAYNNLVAGLADSGSVDFGLKIWMPTSITTKDDLKTATITLVASCD